MSRQNRKKKTRAQKMAGGSMMSDPKRNTYAEGGISSEDMQIGGRSQDPQENISNYLHMEEKIASLLNTKNA